MNLILKKIVQPHWYLTSAIVFAFMLAIGLRKPLAEFSVLDPIPVIKKYDSVEKFSPVQTGLLIKNFGKFDVQKDMFSVDASVWFLFDPKKIKQETIGAFSFETAEVLQTSPPQYIKVDEKTMAWYEVRVKFSTNLDYHLFPVDDHYISLVLYNKSLINEGGIYQANSKDFQYEQSLHPQGWQIVNKIVQAGYGQQVIHVDDASYTVNVPRASFTLSCSRIGVRHLMIIMLPLFLIYCIALISFLLNVETQQEKIIEIISGSLAGLIGYRFVLESMSPSTDYFMISDYIYLIFLTALFVLFLIALLQPYIPHWLRGLLILLLHLGVALLWYYYFNMWLIP